MSYYKTIDGKKMDGKLLEEASRLVQGAGDGRISNKDAEALLALVTDGNVFTEVEQVTVEYLFAHFNWTPAAATWFRNELRVWQTHKTPIEVTIADLSGKHFAKTDVHTDPEARATRKHALEAATSETVQDHDDIALWIRLADGTTVRVSSNFIELENDFVELRGGFIVPIRAIEKVEL